MNSEHVTRYPAPPPALRRDAGRLRALLDESLGAPLSEVKYACFEGNGEPSLWDWRREGVEPVDLAVVLRLGRRWVRVDWSAPSITVGLSVLSSPELDFRPWTVMDATGTAAWSACRDRPLTGFGLAWFAAEAGAEEALLALRLVFGEVTRTIMLGEIADSGVAWLPDALVVVHDHDLADDLVARFGGVWEAPEAGCETQVTSHG